MVVGRALGIYEIENFMDPAYCRGLYEYCSNIDRSEIIGERSEILDIPVDYSRISELLEKISTLFDPPESLDVTNLAIHKSCNGSGLDLHYDSEGDSSISYAAIFYINEDFDGGYLVYPDEAVAIKPKSGSLVIHEGGKRHFVSMFPENQERFFITVFAKTKNGQHVNIDHQSMLIC